jgi:hypothetical protein
VPGENELLQRFLSEQMCRVYAWRARGIRAFIEMSEHQIHCLQTETQRRALPTHVEGSARLGDRLQNVLRKAFGTTRPSSLGATRAGASADQADAN